MTLSEVTKNFFLYPSPSTHSARICAHYHPVGARKSVEKILLVILREESKKGAHISQ
jgi:hypothetical protein